ncbi:hypothetical protein [Staphylococcus phage PT1-1]
MVRNIFLTYKVVHNINTGHPPPPILQKPCHINVYPPCTLSTYTLSHRINAYNRIQHISPEPYRINHMLTLLPNYPTI